jgi:hypothetical protein
MKDLMSDTDQVFQHLKSISASYVALFHCKGPCDEMKPAAKSSNGATDCKDHGEELVIERVSEAGETIISKVNCTGTGEKNKQVMKHAASTRSIIDADDGQDILVALVWTTPAGKRCFQAFPEQVSVDEMHSTNDKEWGLLTFTIQDMSGKQETVIRCWSPNNRAWLFCWLFQTSMPSLVGAAACRRTCLIICDGDPQECSQLDDAIQVVFIRAKRHRCGWHIVDRGWNNHFRKNLGGRYHPNGKAINAVVQNIKNWLYSFMKEIETKEEYKCEFIIVSLNNVPYSIRLSIYSPVCMSAPTYVSSKAMLLAYVQSPKVSSIIDEYNVKRILTWLHNHVFVHEQLYARCYYLHVPAIDAWTNTPHEGTNRGLKYAENRVLPSMSQAQATKVLTDQDFNKAKIKKRAASSSFHKTQLHSSTGTSQDLQKESESMLQEEIIESEQY